MRSDSLPRVPISKFKSNPVRYIKTGAVVTNHGKEQATFLPIEHVHGDQLETAKATLRLLYRVQPVQDVAAEIDELSKDRDRDLVGEPR